MGKAAFEMRYGAFKARWGFWSTTRGFKARRGTPRRYKDRGVDH